MANLHKMCEKSAQMCILDIFVQNWQKRSPAVRGKASQIQVWWAGTRLAFWRLGTQAMAYLISQQSGFGKNTQKWYTADFKAVFITGKNQGEFTLK